jgi:hypothetical protein
LPSQFVTFLQLIGLEDVVTLAGIKNDAVGWTPPSCVALIPLFDGEKQQKTPVPALRGRNWTLQLIDSI